MMESLLFSAVISLILLRVSSAVCPVQLPDGKTCSFCEKNQQNEWNIDCNSQSLSAFPDIDSGTVIGNLFLHGNQITSIPLSKVDQIDSIKKLDLSGNRLTATNFLQSSSLNQIEELLLAANPLNTAAVRTEDFTSLTLLRLLDISDSSLENVYFLYDVNNINQHLVNLETLDISYNRLGGTADIHVDVFNGKTLMKTLTAIDSGISGLDFLKASALSNLTSLYLQRNSINSLNMGHVRYLNSLRSLNLNDNNLATLSPDVMSRLPSIQSFQWERNPVLCDCNISWITEWLSANTGIMTYPTTLDTCTYVTNPEQCATTTTAQTTPTQTTGANITSNSPPNATTSGNPGPTTGGRPPPMTTTSIQAGISSTVAPPTSLSMTEIIVIVVVAGIVVIVVVIVVVVVILRRKRKRPSRPAEKYRQTGPRAPSGRTHKKSSPTSISHNRLSDPNGNRPLPDPTQIPNEDNYGYLNPGEDKYGYTVPIDPEEGTGNGPTDGAVDSRGYLVPRNLNGAVDSNGDLIQTRASTRTDGYIEFNPNSDNGIDNSTYETLPKENRDNVYESIRRNDRNVSRHDSAYQSAIAVDTNDENYEALKPDYDDEHGYATKTEL